jgi:PAS domain S-box-containing protein
MRILYIEDNPLDAELTRRELERGARHRVQVATTLAEARGALGAAREPFDLALVDLDLPDGSGLEFVLAAREGDLPLAIVVLTGSGDERSAVAALKAGADDYLVKGGDHVGQLPQVLESARAAFGAGRARRTRPIRVLYGEHNALDIDIVRRHLARHAPHILFESALSGDEVLARLARPGPAPDVLLLDYRMRGFNALELVDLLRTRGLLTMPVVLVTGQGDEAVAVRALRAGVADYLVKRPAYLHELAATLENTHHRAQLWREQAALRASEERFRQLAENIDEVFWISDPAHTEMLYVSPAFAKVWGRPVEELLAAPRLWLDAVPPDDRAPVLAWREAVAAGEGTRVVEYRIQRPDGGLRWIRDRASPVRDVTGRPYRVVGVAEDITQRRQLEDQLRQAQRMEAIGQLSGGVAHDFNNLLTIIHGHIGLLEAGGHVAAGGAASLEQIGQAATRATNLTRQLLTFSRKQVMQSRDLDLRVVVADLAKMLQRILGEDVELRVALGDEPLRVHADPGMMEQILMNFTVNARDAMPRGGRVEIALSPETCAGVVEAGVELERPAEEAAHGFVCIRVSDTGEGIAPGVMARIFEPFFTTKPVGKGTGLGLATVYGIVRQHRGGVRASSEPGRGATFEVFLPRVAESSAFADAGGPSRADMPGPGHAGGETVLLVEDDPAVSGMVSLALDWAGYRVLLAPNGRAALKEWAAHREGIDLLLTDFVMPEGMSGRELAERLLVERPGLPVIYMSGYSADIAGRELGNLTDVEFLPKPFGVDTLLRKVRLVLEARRAGGARA